MSGERFDDFTKAVAAGTTRRGFLKRLAGSVAGAGLSLSGASAVSAEDGVTKCKNLTEKCVLDIDCCSKFCDKKGNQCACTPEEIACQDPNSGQLRCVPRCASGLGPCQVDACDPATGQCIIANADGAPCEDGDLCTVGDQCLNGQCRPGPVTVCAQCFRCEPTTGLCEVDLDQVGARCNDNNACTENDACTATGQCVGTPVVCDDNNECTADTCDPATGCVHTPLTGTPCETGNKCTADVCNEGKCEQGPLAVTCPQCQVCNPETGTCVAIANDTPCEDGDVCTLGDTCQGGQCQPGPVKVCDQCEVCADVEGVATCVPDLSKNDEPCEDGNKCTLNDTCQAGVCVSGPLKDCNDNNECTEDSCDPTTGNCVHTPLPGAPCETGNKCTTDVCDEDGQCQQGPQTVTCPQCQVCDPKTGTCVAGPNDVPCEDGDLCTVGDQCQNGTCQPGPVTVCAQCFRCEPTTGLCEVDLAQVDQPCNDNNKCTENEVCTVTGACVGTAVVCNDNNECTADTCDPATGCVHTKLTGTPCETGNKCTADVCENGACKQGPASVTCPQCQVCDPKTGTCKTATDLTPCTDKNNKPGVCCKGTCKPGKTC